MFQILFKNLLKFDCLEMQPFFNYSKNRIIINEYIIKCILLHNNTI